MYTNLSIDRDPRLEPGEIVWATVLNPLENRGCRGKARPAILLERNGGSWTVMGLTTNPTFGDGSLRTAIHDPAALGLKGSSYLWGRPTRISALDVLDHIGWVDEPTATELAGHPQVHCTAAVLLGNDGPPELITAA